MTISTIALPRLAAPAAPPTPATTPSPVAHVADIVDTIKARSTLVALIQPLAWVSELASTPAQTGRVLGDVARHLVHGELGQAGGEFGGLIKQAMAPTGIPGHIYQAGLYAQAGVDALVGGVELYHGFRDRSTALKMMGTADMVGAASSCAFALGNGNVALGLNLASNVARAVMVLARPQDYSRIQKAKTVFDGLASMSAGLMKAGFAPVPALAGYVGFGVTQILYMNSEAFRSKIDAAIDWVVAHKP